MRFDMLDDLTAGLEHKFCLIDKEIAVVNGTHIEGYASLFEKRDQSGDVVVRGAYAQSLRVLAEQGRRVKMLWQHDVREPIGVWDEVREDERGLFVKGRLLTDVARAREAAALIDAGAIDGLSIGYRTRKSTRDNAGRRLLSELELWEVSLVTFPMLSDARVDAKDEGSAASDMRDLAAAIDEARRMLARD